MSAQEQKIKSSLTRRQILAALRALSKELGKQNVTGEICLFGGTVMVLAFTARLATKDVDAVFQPAQTIRELARRIVQGVRPEFWAFLSEGHTVALHILGLADGTEAEQNPNQV